MDPFLLSLATKAVVSGGRALLAQAAVPGVAAKPFRIGGKVDLAHNYEVIRYPGGGLGTQHILSGKQVPHVQLGETTGSQMLGRFMPQNRTFSQINQVGQHLSQQMSTLQSGLSIVQGLQVANIGVSLLNLGVSAYTAYKVSKMSKVLDKVQDTVEDNNKRLQSMQTYLEDSVQHLSGMIETNTQLMVGLHQKVDNLEQGLGVIAFAMKHGFESIDSTIYEVDQQRRLDEQNILLKELLHYYKICIESLKNDEEVPENDCRCVIERAVSYNARVAVELDKYPIGAPQRFPLFVNIATAMRFELEARQMSQQAVYGGNTVFKELIAVIKKEIEYLLHEAKMVDVAVYLYPLLRQYMYLYRALNGAIVQSVSSNHTVTTMVLEEALDYDDGWEAFREALKVSGDSVPVLEIESMRDFKNAKLMLGYGTDEVRATEINSFIGLEETYTLPEESYRNFLDHASSYKAPGQFIQEELDR